MSCPRLPWFRCRPRRHGTLPARHALRGRVRPLGLVVAVVLLCAVAAAVWWWRGQAARQAAAPVAAGTGAGAGGPGARRAPGAQVQPISADPVRRQDVRVLVHAIGTVAARNTAVVRAKADGELKAIRFKEGDMVRAGQLLAEIDPRNYQAALAQAQGALARDRALLRNAQLDLQRYQDLLAQDSIARQQVDTQAALVRQTQGTVQTDQAQVDAARLQLSYTRVTAPISGRLGLRQADLGNVVRAADTTGIVTITQVRPIHALFSIPEASLPRVVARLRAGAAMPVELWDRDQKTLLATGRLETVDNAIDTATGTIKAKATFANTDGSLFPNQFANVRLQVDTLPGVLTVPTTAVQRGTQGTYVYAVKDDGTVSLRKVLLGTTDGDRISVQGALQEGERVVTDGADRLREGAQVAVIAPDAAARADQAVQASAQGPRGGRRNLPPELAAKVQAMSPEERRAFFRQMRERQQQGAAPGGPGAPGTPAAAPAPGGTAAPAAAPATAPAGSPAAAPAAPAAR
ncbi:MdtA/MuxA family multidrug efflux RND transporter periplasmic adaptor subunit [Xylophilus ampelinus]|nr:MdtA/MuxA family multidrug efflux RND transporter periplasmic adaptor subunit [Xylophilus ampelinus]MCS4510232.1 MdtA/MuxA family multidrug efflux RND transporter periplasmic adaptor subunit [Xylophilus ampelinus]